jgi:OsmC-like protein
MSGFEVTVGAGSLRSSAAAAVRFPHKWTDEGVTVDAAFTGAHLFHLATAGCVLNDLYREAATLGLGLTGVRVTAAGGFDAGSWASTGVTYTVDLDSAEPAAELDRLLAIVDEVAEIPRAVRTGAPVSRSAVPR